jgi:hypothetical protein
MGNNGAGHKCLLEEFFNGVLEKMASEMASCQVCMYGEN